MLPYVDAVADRDGLGSGVAVAVGVLGAVVAVEDDADSAFPARRGADDDAVRDSEQGCADGDGDVGLDESDNAPPFDTASTYYYNLFIEHSEKINGEWLVVEFAQPIHYRIPRITPTGQNKALEGEIAVAIDPFPLYITGNADTVRYSIEMVDRALNRSNRVVTNEIIVP